MYQEFINICVANGCNREFAHYYRVSDMKSRELINFCKDMMSHAELVKSVGYLFRYTIEAAKIVVNDALNNK